LELLDSVERRIARRLLRPEAVAELRLAILERHPDAQV
jgi:hypothetical protein